MMKKVKEKRFKGFLAVAGLLKNKGNVLLVSENGCWTLPVGHVDLNRDANLEETLFRETGEELKGIKNLVIVEFLSPFIRYPGATRNKSSPICPVRKPKIIQIFSCNVSNKEIKYFGEGGKRGKEIWTKPRQALRLSNLDGLAATAIGNFLKKYPGKKEGQNGKASRSSAKNQK